MSGHSLFHYKQDGNASKEKTRPCPRKPKSLIPNPLDRPRSGITNQRLSIVARFFQHWQRTLIADKLNGRLGKASARFTELRERLDEGTKVEDDNTDGETADYNQPPRVR